MRWLVCAYHVRGDRAGATVRGTPAVRRLAGRGRRAVDGWRRPGGDPIGVGHHEAAADGDLARRAGRGGRRAVRHADDHYGPGRAARAGRPGRPGRPGRARRAGGANGTRGAGATRVALVALGSGGSLRTDWAYGSSRARGADGAVGAVGAVRAG